MIMTMMKGLMYEVHLHIQWHLQGLRTVKFVYEGHRVKVKVTGAEKSKIPIRNVM